MSERDVIALGLVLLALPLLLIGRRQMQAGKVSLALALLLPAVLALIAAALLEIL